MKPMPPSKIIPSGPRVPPEARQLIRASYRQDIPLASEAGRVAAEAMFQRPLFDPTLPPLVPVDRFGGPSGWLATWSVVQSYPRRGMNLQMAALLPLRGAGLDDAYAHQVGGQVELLILIAPHFPKWGYRQDVWADWQRKLAELNGCPDLDQNWAV